MHQDQRDLGELRRLDLEAAGQRDPRLRAVDVGAERGEHGQQGQQRQRRRPTGVQAFSCLVVGQADHEHQDQPDDHPEQLLLQVGARVLAGREQLGWVADQTSRTPRALSAATTRTSSQSMCRSAEFLANARASRDRERPDSAPGRGAARPRAGVARGSPRHHFPFVLWPWPDGAAVALVEVIGGVADGTWPPGTAALCPSRP